MVDVKNVWSIIEDLDNHLRRKVGLTRLPLAYVVWSEVGLPANADDPGYGQSDPMTEMIRWGNHEAATFTQDNVGVWAVIRHVAHAGPGWS